MIGINLDIMFAPYLLCSDKSIATVFLEFFTIFTEHEGTSGIFKKIDKECNPNSYYISDWLNELTELYKAQRNPNSEFIPKISCDTILKKENIEIFVQKNKNLVGKIFENLFNIWHNSKTNLDNNTLNRYLQFLASAAAAVDDHELLKKFDLDPSIIDL